MPNIRTGQWLPCIACGELFWRRRSYIARGIRKSCGKRECKTIAMSGANNPFWGKSHSPETLARIEASKRARPSPQRKGGPPKGYKHTPEARAQMSAALRKRWAENRDKQLAAMRRDPKPREEQRYRRQFTPVQREEWADTKCRWCDATEDLVLDHIIPVMAGGINERRNAQTLCRSCNIWKMAHVDRPLFLAGLGSQGGQNR